MALVECGGARAPGSPHVTAPRAPVSPAAPRAPGGRVADSVHVLLGVPSDADASDDYLIDEGAYVLSYNRSRSAANWVAWRLDASELGHLKRRNDFRPDPQLPNDFYRVSDHDYRHSGYDRGHLCPSADREGSREDNERTFLFTNVVPQVHELNSGPWEDLEKMERQLAAHPGSMLYIVAGGVYREPCTRIGGGVAVPIATYKIIAVMREGESAAELTPDHELYAVEMPNERWVEGHSLREFSTSVDRLEAATGYDFLNRVPEPAQRALEARTASL